MRGSDLGLTIGERVGFYRRRRGMSQPALAGLVGRTVSWLEKVENGRAALDRVSVIRELAGALDLSLHDLLPDDIVEVRGHARGRSVPALRDMVLSYRAVNPRLAIGDLDRPVLAAGELHRVTDDIWNAYQDSRFGYVVMRLNDAIPAAYLASRSATTPHAQRALAYLYQAAASVLVKLGDVDLARVCADRGDIAAQEAGDPITRLCLHRSVAHTLLSNGQFGETVALVREGVIDGAELDDAAGISVVGTMMLVGATACARAGEPVEAEAFLRHAGRLAERLGSDRNEVWTSFGPTNVAIHRVTVAAELGDPRRALSIGEPLDVTRMPRERRMRHQLELARALSAVGRNSDALAALLSAEAGAPEQVRRHFLTHELVHRWIRTARPRPSPDLVALAQRLGHAA